VRFTDVRRLRIVFERCEGMTPAEYRRQHLAKSNARETASPTAPAARPAEVIAAT
jgi:hypothetical protein